MDGILHSREWALPCSNYADPGFYNNPVMMKVMMMLLMMMMVMMMVMMTLMRMPSANYADLDILSFPDNLCLTLRYF